MDGLDTHLFSWTDYGDSQGATWAPSSLQQLVWARSYARAVAGTPLNMTFNDGSKKGFSSSNTSSAHNRSGGGGGGSGGSTGKASFEFCWILDASIKAPTEVFASTKHHYQNGVRVKTTPNVVAAQHPGSDDVWLLTGDPIHAVAAVAADGGSDSVACVWLDAK